MIVHPVDSCRKFALSARSTTFFLSPTKFLPVSAVREKCLPAIWPIFLPTSCAFQGHHWRLSDQGVTLCTDRVESAFRSENRLHSSITGIPTRERAGLRCRKRESSDFDDEPVFDRIPALPNSWPSGFTHSVTSIR